MKSFLFLFSICISLKLFAQNVVPSTDTLEVLVYPNPINDICVIKAEGGAKCTLISSSGTIIGTWIIDSTNQLYINDLTSGVFQLIVEKETKISYKKIVVI